MNQKRVLIVDDELDIAEVVEMKIETLPVEVSKALCIESALAIIEKERIDFIISDMILPDGSGLDLLKSLRALSYSIPFIFFSGANKSNFMIESLKYGAIDFIEKPGLDEIYNATKDALSIDQEEPETSDIDKLMSNPPKKRKKKSIDDSLVLGIESIDSQHSMIIGLIDELSDLLHSDKNCSFEYIRKINLYISERLGYEEKLFEKHYYPDRNDHINKHIKLKKTLKEFEGKMELNKEEGLKLLALLNFFRYEHIPVHDKKYVEFLKKKGVT